MDERYGRKVLISVKVSTLLLILLGIIAVIVIVNVVSNKLASNKLEVIDTATDVEEIDEPQVTPIQAQSAIQAQITSRSSTMPRHHEENHIIAEPINNEEIIEEPETTPIEDVTISKDMDLTITTGLSKEDFVTLISGVEQDTTNFFEENAELIYDVCQKYEINEIFFCGLISAESGWDIAANHRNTYNYISLMSGSGLIKFSSVEDGMEKAAQTLHNNYLAEGGCFYHGSTLAGVKTKFCPASSTWVNLVYNRMEQILK